MEKKEITYTNMIKTIISKVDNAGIYQSVSLILFMLFFISLIVFVHTKPKEYYKYINHLPLED